MQEKAESEGESEIFLRGFDFIKMCRAQSFFGNSDWDVFTYLQHFFLHLFFATAKLIENSFAAKTSKLLQAKNPLLKCFIVVVVEINFL